MNQLNQMLEQYQEKKTKLFMMRMEQSVFQTAEPEEVASVLKESQFAALSLICTDALSDCITLAAKLTHQGIALVLEVGFHKVLRYGLADFAKDAAHAGISGIRIPNLPFEEQGQLAVYLLDENGPCLIREITPASGDRIVQNMQFARGFIWCGKEGNVDFLSALDGDPYVFYLYAAEAAATRPILLDFGSRYLGELENYLDFADGAIVGTELNQTFSKEGYSASALKEYCGRFTGAKG